MQEALDAKSKELEVRASAADKAHREAMAKMLADHAALLKSQEQRHDAE